MEETTKPTNINLIAVLEKAKKYLYNGKDRLNLNIHSEFVCHTIGMVKTNDVGFTSEVYLKACKKELTNQIDKMFGIEDKKVKYGWRTRTIDRWLCDKGIISNTERYCSPSVQAYRLDFINKFIEYLKGK